jgi:hypothetical protein
MVPLEKIPVKIPLATNEQRGSIGTYIKDLEVSLFNEVLRINESKQTIQWWAHQPVTLYIDRQSMILINNDIEKECDAGLLDFSWHDICTKTGENTYTILTLNYQMAIKCTKWV